MSDGTEFIAALQPVVASLGATLVSVGDEEHGDEPVVWRGETVAFIRSVELHGALGRLVGTVEREIGESLPDMSRGQKQDAIRRLDELGAFLLRGSVEDLATLMDVSRVTLYTYLNAVAGSGPEERT